MCRLLLYHYTHGSCGDTFHMIVHTHTHTHTHAYPRQHIAYAMTSVCTSSLASCFDVIVSARIVKHFSELVSRKYLSRLFMSGVALCCVANALTSVRTASVSSRPPVPPESPVVVSEASETKLARRSFGIDDITRQREAAERERERVCVCVTEREREREVYCAHGTYTYLEIHCE